MTDLEREDWDEVYEVDQAAGARDKMKHIEKDDQLFVTRMMYRWTNERDQG